MRVRLAGAGDVDALTLPAHGCSASAEECPEPPQSLHVSTEQNPRRCEGGSLGAPLFWPHGGDYLAARMFHGNEPTYDRVLSDGNTFVHSAVSCR